MKKRVRTLIFLAVFILCVAGSTRLSGAEPENTAQTDETPDSASDNYLSSLRIAQSLLSPEFSPEQLTYTASVPYDVTRIVLTADTRSGQARKVISGTGDLAVGENTVTIVVTAQDGSIREYRVTVIREEAEGGETRPEEPSSSEEPSTEEPVTESSPEEPVTEPGAETPAVPQTEEPTETPAVSQTEEPAETPAVSQPEEPVETPGFQTEADSGNTGDGRLFGLNPMILLLGAVCLLLLFVIIAVLLLRREIDGEEDEEEEDFDSEDEADRYDDGIDEEDELDGYDGDAESDGYDRSAGEDHSGRDAEPDRCGEEEETVGYNENRKPDSRAGKTGSGRSGQRRAVREHSASKNSEKAESTEKDADAAGMVTPEELARFYRALNLDKEVVSSSESGSVSDDLDDDLEILDLEEEAPADVSRSGIEKDDDFDFLDL